MKLQNTQKNVVPGSVFFYAYFTDFTVSITLFTLYIQYTLYVILRPYFICPIQITHTNLKKTQNIKLYTSNSSDTSYRPGFVRNLMVINIIRKYLCVFYNLIYIVQYKCLLCVCVCILQLQVKRRESIPRTTSLMGLFKTEMRL